jgi:hypothetical protein
MPGGRKIHPKDQKFKRIRALRCYEMVKEMLACGYPAPSVADFIKQQGEYEGVSKKSLVVMLNNFRSESILPLDVLTNRMPHIIIEAKKQYTDKLEELRRMEIQYEAMLYRFDLIHARERHFGVIDPESRASNREITDLLFKMHKMKMDLGISGQKADGTTTVSPERLEEIRQRYGDAAARAMADPVSRAKVLSMMRSIQDAVTYDEEKEMDGETIDIEGEEEEKNEITVVE